jgi:hypothetical protein
MTTKQRIAVPKNTEVHGPVAPHVQVLDTATGPLTWLDKLKGYYKGLITLVGVVLVILNQVTPVFDFMPANVQHWFTVVVAALTAVSAFLVANQHWVDDA